MCGSCTITIRINNHGEYLKWKKYHPEREWEFVVDYPAFLRMQFTFQNMDDVEQLARQIIQLLSMGFDVYSANWRLKEYPSQLKAINNYGIHSEHPTE